MWDVVRTFWCGLPPQVQAAVIGALTTVSSAIIGLYVVFWQIGRQARNAIGQNRHNETLKLKLKIYEEIVAISRDSSDAEIALSSYVRGFQTDIFLSRQMILSSLPSLIPKARAPVLLEKKSTLGSQTIKIISVTERWQIIDPRIEIFRTAINVANYDIDAAFQAYFSAAIRLMPHEMPSGHPQQGTVIPWSPPNDQVSQQFERVGQDVINALMNLGSYICDFQIEMQNLLVGELFKQTLPPRKPIGPSLIVVTLDKHEELTKHFEQNTAWGRNKSEIEARVAAAVNQPTPHSAG